MIVGSTGTKRGMTDAQWSTLGDLVAAQQTGPLENRISYWHHGDCVGADAQCHVLALQHKIPVHLHPMEPDHFRAYCRGALFTNFPKDPLKRNVDIARVIDKLFVTPKEFSNVTRSGTWHAVRKALEESFRRKAIDIVIILPDGTISSPDRINMRGRK